MAGLFKKYVNISIVTSIVGALFSIGLVWAWKLPGALISAVTYQSIVFFITLLMVIKSKWFILENFNAYFFLHYCIFSLPSVVLFYIYFGPLLHTRQCVTALCYGIVSHLASHADVRLRRSCSL